VVSKGEGEEKSAIKIRIVGERQWGAGKKKEKKKTKREREKGA